MTKVIDFMKKYKKLLTVTTAILTLTGVAFIYPEHTETVAKAFLVIIGIL
jgi:hypothetical protein